MRLLTKLGFSHTSLVAVLVVVLGLIGTSFTFDSLPGLFCIAGFVTGTSTSLLYTATNVLPSQWFSSRLGTANGIVKAGGGLGATVMPLIVQALLSKVGLAWTFRVLGCFVALIGIPCALILKERAPRHLRVTRFNWSLLKNIPFLTLSIAGGIGVFALFVPPFFLPLFANSIGLPSSTGAGLVAGFGASTFIGRLLAGYSCDRIGALNTLAITTFVNSITMLAIWPISNSLGPLLVFAIINGFANGSFFSAIPTSAAALAPEASSASISLMTSFWTPGYLLGAPFAGMLINAHKAGESTSVEPYRAAIFYAAGTGVLATLLVIVVRLGRDKKLIKKL